MANLLPFRGLRYDRARFGTDLGPVITQPYDKITAEMQAGYYDRSPHSYVRLVLNRAPDPYADAARTFGEWRQTGVLVRDTAPAFYPCHQAFTIDGTPAVRRGWVGVCQLEEFEKGVVLPHERTLSKPKADRLNLMRATAAHLEQILILYADPAGAVEAELGSACAGAPDVAATDEYGTTHRLWTARAPATCRRVHELMADKVLYIADGHHRYETALTYRNEQRAAHPDWQPDDAFNYRMMTLANLYDPGLRILPTHRLVAGLAAFNEAGFLDAAHRLFAVEAVDRSALAGRLRAATAPHTIGIATAGGASLLVTLRDRAALDRLLPDRSADYRELDVTVLHALLIEHLLGIPAAKIEDHVRYAKDAGEVLRQLAQGEAQLGFLLNPTRPEQVERVARNHERMPQKSTDFFPKLISGLVAFDVAWREKVVLPGGG